MNSQKSYGFKKPFSKNKPQRAKRNLARIGAIWQKPFGGSFQIKLEGIGDIDGLVYENKNKKEAKHPDFYILVDADKFGQLIPEDAPTAPKEG